MRLAFVGATAFSARCFESCVREPSVSVVGVVTAPPRFPISYRPEGVVNVRHSDLAGLADELGVPSVTVGAGMRDPHVESSVASWRPDALIVAGWYHMVPRSWRDRAPAYGLHASLLPAYRGGAPLVWAMINGERETGISLFQLDDGVDTGPIVGQRTVRIVGDDTIKTLYARIENEGVALIRDHLPEIARGTVTLRAQPDGPAKVWPQRGPEDGQIDWEWDAISIDRFVRAQTRPYPGAFTTLGEDTIHIWRCERAEQSASDLHPGYVLRDGDGYAVSCGSGTLRLREVSDGRGATRTGADLEELLGDGGQTLGVL